MSILQKIIQDMYIEPELLAELDDEQKQILFCKMREEQLRRWKEYEKTFDEPQQAAPSQPKEARIRWLLGKDGQPWVWVMGEHAQDKTIEQILEEETQEKARKLAEQETEQLRRIEEEELKEKLRQEQLEAEKERNVLLHHQLNNPRNNFEDSFKMANNNNNSENVMLSTANSDLSRPGVDVILRQKQTKSTDNGYLKGNNELEQKLREETDKRIEEEKTRRTSEIYQSLIEARERANLEAEKEAEEERRYWEEQERKSREAEEQIRLIARKAREQHKMHGLRTSSSLLSLFENESSAKIATIENGKNRNVVKLSRPLKPKSRGAIIEWFMKEELPNGAGLVPGTSRVAPWLHGLISRDAAEQLLAPNSSGAYLLRVSERIWGYVLSYKSTGADSSPFKHFLIERLPNGYQFLGTNQIVHERLWDLITYHQTTPITLKGKEVLRECVGQNKFPPDYQELLGFGRTAGIL